MDALYQIFSDKSVNQFLPWFPLKTPEEAKPFYERQFAGKYGHKGIATEAGMAVIARLRKDGIAYITATHDVNNPRSGGVMRRLGMQYQYSYQEQWQPKDILVTFRMYQLNLDGVEHRVYKGYWNHARVAV